VQPITLIKNDLRLEHTQQVAVSNTFICYGLKAGQIRALNRSTADRALFKGHPAPLSHMAFFSPATNLLASASHKGDLTVRQLAAAPGEGGADGTILGGVMLQAQLPGTDAAADDALLVALAWHPRMQQILAAAAGDCVGIFEVPLAPPVEGGSAPAPCSPGICYSISGAGASAGSSVSSLAFSPSGDLLVAGDSSGRVCAWWMEGGVAGDADTPVLAWQPFSGAGGSVASMHFLHEARDGSTLLLTGDATNSCLKLWALPSAARAAAEGGGAAPRCLQTLSLVGSRGGGEFFCHVAVQRDLQLVVLANTPRKQVYTLHYSTGAEGGSGVGDAAFAYAAFFCVKQPILSLAAISEAADAGTGARGASPGPQQQPEQQAQQLTLYCVQTDAVQQYALTPALCMAAGTEEQGAEEAAAAAPAPAPAVTAESQTTQSSPPTPAAAVAAAADAVSDATSPASPAPAAAAAVPPPAKLPTPSFLGARKAAQQASAAAAATPGTPASPPAAAAEAPEPAKAESGKRARQQGKAAAGAAAAAADAVDAAAAAAAVPAAVTAGAPAVTGDAGGLQQQMQQLLSMQQQMAAQLQATNQQMVAGVKADVARALKATEAALLKQVGCCACGWSRVCVCVCVCGGRHGMPECAQCMAQQQPLIVHARAHAVCVRAGGGLAQGGCAQAGGRRAQRGCQAAGRPGEGRRSAAGRGVHSGGCWPCMSTRAWTGARGERCVDGHMPRCV
jgi:enhancer of mRNA-decapping protein 4